jgi:uncharacterized membrane protein
MRATTPGQMDDMRQHDGIGSLASDGLEARIVEQARRAAAARHAARVERSRSRVHRGYGAAVWGAAHWLLIVNLANALVLLGTVLAPWLRAHGYDGPAAALYDFYRLQCLQRPDHSFFLFGERLGMEQRMLAIYAGWLAAGLAFVLLRDSIQPLSLMVVGLASLPMVADIASQMIGLRDSDWSWRVSTGLLFAVASAWWVFPWLDRAEVMMTRAGVRSTAARENSNAS